MLPKLKKGDTIAMVAPARKISVEELRPAIYFLEHYGFKVVIMPNCYAVDRQFAGTDEQRLKDVQTALDSADIQAIFFVRGGYGCVRLIDKLNFNSFRQNPKWLVGYSDITVFHSHVVQNIGLPTLHAIMPINFKELSAKSNESVESMITYLEKGSITYVLSNVKVFRYKPLQGKIVGGNLSVLYSLLGSPSDIDTYDKVLFIEDLDEYLYHIDRMMMALKRAGKLEKLKALIVGGMSDMKDNAVAFGLSAEQIILDAVKEYDFPVFTNFPAGHIEKNLAIPMGGILKIEDNCFTFTTD